MIPPPLIVTVPPNEIAPDPDWVPKVIEELARSPLAMLESTIEAELTDAVVINPLRSTVNFWTPEAEAVIRLWSPVSLKIAKACPVAFPVTVSCPLVAKLPVKLAAEEIV